TLAALLRRVIDPPRSPDAPACIIFHGPGVTPGSFGGMAWSTASGEPPALQWQPVDALLKRPRALAASAVLLVDSSIVDQVAAVMRLPRHLVIVALDEAAEGRLGRRVDVSLVGLREVAAKNHLLATAARLANLRHRAMRQRRHLRR